MSYQNGQSSHQGVAFFIILPCVCACVPRVCVSVCLWNAHDQRQWSLTCSILPQQQSTSTSAEAEARVQSSNKNNKNNNTLT